MLESWAPLVAYVSSEIQSKKNHDHPINKVRFKVVVQGSPARKKNLRHSGCASGIHLEATLIPFPSVMVFRFP